MRLVTHIVPFFAPTIDGVGDYALNLARHLRESHGIDSRFHVWDRARVGPNEIDNFQVEKLNSPPEGRIILHYVGYGYHPRGIPIRFVKTILPPRGPLLTIFHEVWSKGPPTSSVFYLSPLQKALVDKMARASVASFVSTQSAIKMIPESRWLPVPANLPIVPRTSPLPAEPMKFLIFGQADTRLRAADGHARWLPARASVVLAGKQSAAASPEVEVLKRFIPDLKIEVAGEIANTQIFSEADALLSSHRGADVCKSGALMAALASGCPAILADDSDPAPLRIGRELLTWKNLDAYKTVAPAARDWYYKNADWRIVAKRVAEALP